MPSNFSTNLHTYSFIRSDRVYGKGGGVGIMIHNDVSIISSNCLIFSYSDGLSITLKSPMILFLKLLLYILHLIIILHIFLMNFLILLLIRIYIYNTICVGDFNFHYGSLISPKISLS